MTRQMILSTLFAVPGVRTASILDQSANGDKGAMTTVNVPMGVVLIHVTGGDLLAIGRALLKLRALGIQYEIVHTPVAVLQGNGKLTMESTFGTSEAYVGHDTKEDRVDAMALAFRLFPNPGKHDGEPCPGCGGQH